VLQEGQSAIINWILQSVTGGRECDIKLDVVECNRGEKGGNNLDIVECCRRD
jgi:hypothetical protein